MIPLGFEAPDFLLLDTISGVNKSFEDLQGTHGTVVVFMCNHCPFVVHILDRLVEIAHEYLPKGIGFITVSSNDVANYPDDSPEKMSALAKAKGFPFAYLYDESQAVAKAYDAACTPDFSVFDTNKRCVYRGQFDGARPGNDVAVTGIDLANALDLLIAGKTPPAEGQIPSLGCNIKWKQA
jgi:peroxiredoxin